VYDEDGLGQGLLAIRVAAVSPYRV
jgi:hypothetical protein